MDNNKETFEYTYSAKQKEEVEKIRKKYLPKEEDKMEQLRKLDQSVQKSGTKVAIILGVVGTLIMGLGMCCIMEWGGVWFLPGIVIGVIGIVILGLAYPVYGYKIKKQREKIAPQILALTEELSR